ncbi:CRTAC1 family protein [Acidicapsa ligni]|uniref:CRTAC1 family protein n=1 Tax=Acidicapsa ligni TaxID=542300 RepID=UPI0021DFE4A8|nr:CRTAC1 family protein [Acidicapsa ligni]
MSFSLRTKITNIAVASILFAAVLPAVTTAVYSQDTKTPPNKAQTAPTALGSATGAARAAILDNQQRPITAGGFVKDGALVFKDVSESAGISTWHHHMGSVQKDYILDTIGSGVALIDYDKDGWLDLYFVNGSTYEALAGKADPPHAALFHNNHDGTFTDVTAKAGVNNDRWGYGVAVGDYDNDGWPDLYVANFGKNRLYHNNHDGTFTDVAEHAGVTLGNWSTGPSFGDYDGDGLLDLFVPGYIHWDVDNPPLSGTKAVGYAFCEFRGAKTMCGPRGLLGEADHLFHNNGDGTFTDVSEKAGVGDADHYYGFSSTFVDVNHDGKVDLVVTNDSSPNYLYLNNGNGTFENASFYSGFALNQSARETASMGLAVGDYLNNGSVDLFTTTFSDDYDTLFKNDGEGNFSEISSRLGLAELTYPFLSWGTQFIDYDNDGWKDLMTVSGHVYPAVDQHDWGTTWAERPLLFHNVNHGKHFDTVPAVEGSGLADVIPARGAAFGDLFNDGKIDVVINCIDHSPVLLRNVNADTNHWVGLQLIGGPKGPRDAVGATVFITAGGIRQRGDVMSGGSFESSNDQRLHFGIGQATSISTVEIHWPGGDVEHVNLPGIDRIFVIEQGKGVMPSVYDNAGHPHTNQARGGRGA